MAKGAGRDAAFGDCPYVSGFDRATFDRASELAGGPSDDLA